jgi:hypothetical protein
MLLSLCTMQMHASNPAISPSKIQSIASEQIPVRKPCDFNAKATVTLKKLHDLTLQESLPTSSARQNKSNLIDFTKDSIITDGIYGAGL